MKDITKDLKKNAKIKILGFSLPIFGLISFILMLQLYFDYKPDCPPKISTVKGFPTWHTLITPLLMTMLISDLLVFIGKKTPILKDIGGGSILCILLPSFLLTYKFSENPAIKNLQDIVSNNMKSFNSGKGIGFPNFVVSAIIVGSFVNMDLKLLKKSFKKFFPLVL
ncbi:2-hydroxycarboxylate transporter family protein, partial [Candidatus Phytoplasma phoenicium]